MIEVKDFVKGLDKYLSRRFEVLGRNKGLLIGGFVVVVLTASFIQLVFSRQWVVLEVGAHPYEPQAVDEAVYSAAEIGDYRAAEYFYSLLPRLDVLGNTGLEAVVYPDVALKRELAELERAAEVYEEYRDLLLRMSVVSYMLKDDEKSIKYLRHAEVLDPNSDAVREVKLKIGR